MLKKIIIILVLIGLVIGGYSFYPFGEQKIVRSAQTGEEGGRGENGENGNEGKSIKILREDENAIPVTVVKIGSNISTSRQVLGTVKPKGEVEIFATTIAQIDSVLVKEGQKVAAGDVLFRLGETSGTKHFLQTQAEIAWINYNSALTAFELTQETSDTLLRVAEIQLENVVHQLQSSEIDLEGFDENIETAEDVLSILEDNLEITQDKSEDDLDAAEENIENLEDQIDDLESSRDDLQDQEPTDIFTQADIDKAIAQLDSQISVLESQLDVAENGLDSLESGLEIAENQLLLQIEQADSQIRGLELTRDSLETKLGFADRRFTALLLAEEGLVEAEQRSELSLLQAESQLALAKENYEAALNQEAALVVKAPVNGTLTEIFVDKGDIVGPQVPMTSIIAENELELQIRVDIVTAKGLRIGDDAAVEIDGEMKKAEIVSVAPVADANSKLVKVVLDLPRAVFFPNQTLTAMISVKPEKISRTGGAFFIPLDSLIIGTEETYVFVYDRGLARKVNVKVGAVSGDFIEVVLGLTKDDLVVVENAKNLLEDQAVTLMKS